MLPVHHANKGATVQQATAKIIDDMPIEAYHADHAVSKSGIKLLLEKTPAHYFYEYRRPRLEIAPEPKGEKLFGQAFHDYVLSPTVFAGRYVEWTGGDRRGKKWTSFKEAAAKAKQLVLDTEDLERLVAMRDALYMNDDALRYLGEDMEIEKSFFWTDPATGVRCKCRPDMLRRTTMLAGDLKTCRSANDNDLMWDILNYGYHIQDASYTAGVSTFIEDGSIQDFGFVFIESSPPHCINVKRLSAAYKQLGYIHWRRGLEQVAACERTGHWPGYPPGIGEIDPPQRHLNELRNSQPQDDHDETEEYIIVN